MSVLSAMRVTVLDDDEDNVVLLRRLLTTAGLTAVAAMTDSQIAVEELVRDPPDLLLLDLHMPQVDGFEVLARLGRHISGPTPLPVLVLSADMADSAKRQALAAGARDFLAKPYDLREVLLRVGNLLETKYLYDRLDEHNRLLERSDGQRSTDLRAIAADLAHELRTPLYSIRGMVEVMLFEGQLPAPVQRDLSVIDDVAASALEVVDRQIAVARTSAAPSPIELGPVRVAELVTGIEKMMRPLAQAQRISLRVGWQADLEDMHTDGVMLAQILRNLTANAIRHTHVGGVELTARLVEKASLVAFDVHDSGVGIHPADHQRIFEAFERARDVEGQGPGGLGLPLARRLARMLGGDVTVASRPGGGSTFTATVAIGATDPSQVAYVP